MPSLDAGIAAAAAAAPVWSGDLLAVNAQRHAPRERPAVEAIMRVPVLLLLALALSATSGAALASRPVRKVMTGCVMMTGEFFNQDGYRLRLVARDGAEVDLLPYRQKQLRLDGWLRPGDRYTLAAPPRVLGRCPAGR